MRKILALIIITALIDESYSQSYIPLPDSNANWCILYNNGVIPPPFHWYTNYWETSYAGDTIISDKNYIKIEKTEYDIFCINIPINGPNYIGALRDDPNERKVFLIPEGENTEELIYDFNLGIGDTLYSYLNSYDPIIVDYIDSVFINNQYHKRFVFQYYEAEIIEGIGSTTGIIEDLIAFEGGSSLCALYVDTTFVYPDYPCILSSTDTCLVLNIQALGNNDINYIYPNPASTHIYLSKPKSTIQLHNLKGQPVLFSEPGDQKISLKRIPQGIYAATVMEGEKVIAREKLIIQ